MLKKIISLALACLMLLSICGCKNEPDNSSSEAIEVEYQEIIVDESDDIITSSENLTSSEQNISSTDEPANSSTQSTIASDNVNNNTNTYIDYDTVVEVDICDDIVRGYLNAKDATNQYYWLNTYTGGYYNYQKISLVWALDGSTSYTVYISEKSDFSNAQTIETKSFEVKNAVCVPGKTYYWKVTGAGSDEILGGGIIKIKDAPVRWISVDGIRNVRDMGGWKTESGKTVKYEMLYRGQQLNTLKNGVMVNTIKDSGIEQLKKLGIKTELDIRHDSQGHGPTTGTGFNYVYLSTAASYHNIFTYSDEVKNNYKKIFELLSNESNYPIYTHCQGGADRTGTYAFLLNGLLGVSYEDLTRDFELGSLSGQKRWRSAGAGHTFTDNDENMTDGGVTVSWRQLYAGMIDYGAKNGCTTLSQSIEHWFINYVGVPKSQIDSFKNIMLE